MPTYEYACKDCGEHLEVVQSFRDDALTECPSCEGRLRKVFSAAGLIFKGSGWHVKDYANSGRTSGSGGGKEESGSSSGSGESSSDGATKSDREASSGSSSDTSSTDASKSSTGASKSSTDTSKKSA